MKLTRRALLAGLATFPARAQSYPERPIRLIVPFAPGGGGDTLGRLSTQAAQSFLPQPIIIENRPGAGGNIGAEVVARASADGYTLLYGTNGTHGINEALYPRLPFRPDADFIPITALTRIALVVVVRRDFPAETLPGLIGQLRANPGRMTYASAGNGTTGHIASEMFRIAAGVDVTHVPYRGNAAAMTDLAAGRVDMAIELIPAAAALLDAHAIRALAVTSAQSLPSYPALPCVNTVLPGFEVTAWDGIFAPAGTPPSIVNTLNVAYRQGLAKAETVALLRVRGAETAPLESAADFAVYVAAERIKWSAAVRASGAHLD